MALEFVPFSFSQEEKESSNDSSTAFIPPTEPKANSEATSEVCVQNVDNIVVSGHKGKHMVSNSCRL